MTLHHTPTERKIKNNVTIIFYAYQIHSSILQVKKNNDT